MTYTYECECGIFEVQKSIKDHKDKEKCPNCKKKCPQVFEVPHIYCRNITTLGQLSDQNKKDWGKYGLEDKLRKDKQELIDKKYRYALEKGYLTPDKVPTVDQVDEQLKESKQVNNLFKGDKKSVKKKIKKYIEEGI